MLRSPLDFYTLVALWQSILMHVNFPSSVQQQQGSMSHSFLLDDDSSNPFSANDMQHVMDDKPLYTEMQPPEPLRQNPAFEFLYRDLKFPTPQPAM
jgi:hypothetical protein